MISAFYMHESKNNIISFKHYNYDIFYKYIDAKIVNVRKDGKWSHYSLSKDGIQFAIEYLQQLKV